MSCAECYTQPCYNKALTRPLVCLFSLLNVLCRGSPHRTGQFTSASDRFCPARRTVGRSLTLAAKRLGQSGAGFPVSSELCGSAAIRGHPVSERVVRVTDHAPDLHKLWPVSGEPPLSERAGGHAEHGCDVGG